MRIEEKLNKNYINLSFFEKEPAAYYFDHSPVHHILIAFSASIREAIAAPWMKTAKSQLGVKEKTGKNDGPEIEKYLKTVGLGSGYAWCAAFINWTLRQNGILGTGRANALSYLHYGPKLKSPVYGCIAVIKHAHGLGHVGFVAGKTSTGDIVLLGGNQSNMVKYSHYHKTSISTYVYPKGYVPLTDELSVITNSSASSFSQTR